MFDQIGAKIKTLTKVICWIGIAASVILGIVAAAGAESPLFFILVAGVGSLFSWIGSFFLYAFGQLVDSTMNIEEMLKRRGGNVAETAAPVFGTGTPSAAKPWFCTSCGQENSSVSSQCKRCGKFR